MDLRQLATFCAVVDRGSFSGAADDLGISQPAVSSQIRLLEEWSGQRLFDRTGRKVALTDAGRIMESHARRMLDLQRELTRALADAGEAIAGRLELGSSTGPGEILLPRILAAFRDAHPDVTVSLVVHDTQTICDRVLGDELELGIVGAARPQRGLEFTPFLRDELVLITPPGHALATKRAITLQELAATPLIQQQRGGGVRAVVDDAFRAAGFRESDRSTAMELGLQQSVKAAVLDGLGVTIISSLAVIDEVAEGRVVAIPIAEPGLVRDFSLVRSTGRTPSRLSTAFIAFARGVLPENL